MLTPPDLPIERIAAFCQQIVGAQGSREDRERSLGFLRSNFTPNGALELARRACGRRPKGSPAAPYTPDHAR